MKLSEILESDAVKALNDWLLLNFGYTLEDKIPEIEEALENPDNYDELE